jgi:hypothetical protein
MNKRNEKYKLKKIIPNMTSVEKGDLVKDLYLKGFSVRELSPLFSTEIIHVANFLIQLGIYKKICGKCNIEKPNVKFSKDSTRADGLDYVCNNCRLGNFKKNYPKNKNKLLQVSSDWYKNNKDRARKNHKRWREENPYYDEKRAKTPAWADREKMNEIYNEAKNLTETTGIVHEVDHIIPINHPLVTGLHVPENLQILPMFDNRSKGNKFDLQEFNKQQSNST